MSGLVFERLRHKKDVSFGTRRFRKIITVLLLAAFFPANIAEAGIVFKKKSYPEWFSSAQTMKLKTVPLSSFIHSAVPSGTNINIDGVAGDLPVSVNGDVSIRSILDSMNEHLVYEVTEKSITVRGFVTKTFELPQFPVNYNYSQSYTSSGMASSVGTTTGGTSSMGQGQNSTISLQSQQNFWNDIKNEISAIINVTAPQSAQTALTQQGPKLPDSTSIAPPGVAPSAPPGQARASLSAFGGGRSSAGGGYSADGSFVAVNPTASVVMIGTTVSKMRKVEEYMQFLTAKLGESVEVELTVIEINDKNNKEFGISWTTALRTMIFNPNAFLTGAPDASFSVFGNGSKLTSTGGADAYGIKIQSLTHPDQQSFILNALNKMANVKIIEKTTLLLRNNTAGGFSTGTSFSYVDSISETVSQGVSSFSITKATILSGIDVTMSATVNGDKVTLTLLPSISSLKEMQSVSIGNNTIQNPTIDVRKSIATVTVKDGETTAIVGYNNKSTGTNRDSFPILGDLPIVGWLFGKKYDVDEKSSIVMLITPKVKTFSNNLSLL